MEDNTTPNNKSNFDKDSFRPILDSSACLETLLHYTIGVWCGAIAANWSMERGRGLEIMDLADSLSYKGLATSPENILDHPEYLMEAVRTTRKYLSRWEMYANLPFNEEIGQWEPELSRNKFP